MQCSNNNVTTLAVNATQFLAECIAFVQSNDSSFLNSLENTRVHIFLNLTKASNQRCVANSHANTPTSHVVGLRKRVEFDGYVFCTWNRKNAHRWLRLIVVHFSISSVMCDDNVMLFTNSYQLFIELERSYSRSWVIWVVYINHLCAVPRFSGDSVKVRQEVIFFHQRNKFNFATCKNGGDIVYWVVRRAYQSEVAWVDERKWEVRNAFLRTNQTKYFRSRVKFYVEAAAVPISHSLTELQHTCVGWVLVVHRTRNSFLHGLNDKIRRRHVWVANAKADNVNATSGHFGLNFVDARKKIRRKSCQSIGKFEISHELFLLKLYSIPKRALRCAISFTARFYPDWVT